MFSIIVPTFNNLKYLQITLKSIVQNSKFNHDVIVHVNEGTDGTLDYLKTNNINHTYSDKNLGLCSAVNIAAKKASTKYILYCHDDMYLCPNWDFYLNYTFVFLFSLYLKLLYFQKHHILYLLHIFLC